MTISRLKLTFIDSMDEPIVDMFTEILSCSETNILPFVKTKLAEIQLIITRFTDAQNSLKNIHETLLERDMTVETLTKYVHIISHIVHMCNLF
jgi:hypothetical protein